jgi:hypothetical protein
VLSAAANARCVARLRDRNARRRAIGRALASNAQGGERTMLVVGRVLGGTPSAPSDVGDEEECAIDLDTMMPADPACLA